MVLVPVYQGLGRDVTDRVYWKKINAINVIRYEPHALSLRPFKFFFQQLH